MSALQLLAGGVLFLGLQHFGGDQAVIVAAGVLFAIELRHDLGLYRRDRRTAQRRWGQWHD